MALHETGTRTNGVPAARPWHVASPTTSAKVLDHIGPPRHPHRVTIIQLARVHETFEVRWREYIRHDDGRITRQRRSRPGGHTKRVAYTEAEQVWKNLDRSGGFHGGPPRRAQPAAATPPARTLSEVGELWLDQHTGKASTVEWYEALFRACIWPELTCRSVVTTPAVNTTPNSCAGAATSSPAHVHDTTAGAGVVNRR